MLWARLRDRRLQGIKFRRQVPMGPYIVDFVSEEGKLIVELDGGHHVDQQDRDERRTQWLESRGFRVQRYWNDDVLLRLNSVLDAIWLSLQERTPDSPSP